MPDPTKAARELREEFNRKVIEIINSSFDKAGIERITPAVNEIMQRNNVQIATNWNLSTSVSAAEQTGEEYSPEVFKFPVLDFSKSPKDLAPILREVYDLFESELNRVNQDVVVSEINGLMDNYGRSVSTKTDLKLRVSIMKIGPYTWPARKTTISPYRDELDK